MDCERHPGQEAIGQCLECGKGICPQCVTETDQVLICPECFQKEIDRIATAIGMAPGKAPKTRKVKPPKAGKPKKGEVPVAPEAPPAFIQQPVTPLLDVIPAEVQPPPPAEAPPMYAPPPETAAAPPGVPAGPPVDRMPVKPKGKAGKEKPPRVKKEKPQKEKKGKKGEAAVAPAAALPPLVPGMEVSPVEGVPARKPGVPAKPSGKAKKEKPPKARKEKPPKAGKSKKSEITAQPPAFMPPPTGMPSEEGAPPVFEEAPPVEEGSPAGLGEGEGMMEKIRPESVTGEEYLPSPEHLEIMGEPRRGAGVPWGDVGVEAPVEQISEVTVAPGEEAEVPKEDWPVEEGPPSETLEKPTPPPPAPPPFEGPAQAETVEPTVEEVVDVPGEEDYGVKADDTDPPEQPPGKRAGDREELNSFFFEDKIDKTGKDQKEDEEPFWE